MARTVYSAVLAELVNFSGTFTDSPDPGTIFVLRDLDASYDGVSGTTMRLLGAAGQTIDRWHGTVTDEGPHQWRGRQVIAYPGSFSITTTDGTDVTVSGYILTAP